MTQVAKWTGWEAKLLRLATRRNQREFAAEIGVSQRMVSEWEKRGLDITLRFMNQTALDTTYYRAGPSAQERFAALLTEQAAAGSDPRAEALLGRKRHVMTHAMDGKLMLSVEEGIYLAGRNNEPKWLPAFTIDVYPTTNSDYARFVRATRHPAPRHWHHGVCPDSLHDHPVVWVTWHDAATYAAWCGKRLPSSEEWEKAARGPKGRTYPWGDAPTAAKCNVQESDIGHTTPVARYQSGVSPYGVYDMCGNAWEWCVTSTGSGRHELKGSAFTSPFSRAAPSLANDANATMSDNDTGFRCVTPHE